MHHLPHSNLKSNEPNNNKKLKCCPFVWSLVLYLYSLFNQRLVYLLLFFFSSWKETFSCVNWIESSSEPIQIELHWAHMCCHRHFISILLNQTFLTSRQKWTKITSLYCLVHSNNNRNTKINWNNNCWNEKVSLEWKSQCLPYLIIYVRHLGYLENGNFWKRE